MRATADTVRAIACGAPAAQTWRNETQLPGALWRTKAENVTRARLRFDRMPKGKRKHAPVEEEEAPAVQPTEEDDQSDEAISAPRGKNVTAEFPDEENAEPGDTTDAVQKKKKSGGQDL